MSAFDRVPGLRAYLAAQDMQERSQMAELQQAQAIQGIRESLLKRQQEDQLRAALSQANGDPEQALSAALRTGNVAAAHQLAPLVKIAQENRQRQETPQLMGQIFGGQEQAQPQQPVQLAGPESAAAPAAPQAAPASPIEQRIAQLQRMQLVPQVANNSIVSQRLQSEIDRLRTEAAKPPLKRERIEGENLVQEEFDPATRTYKEIGRGPRFAKQVGPTPQEPLVAVKEPGTGRIIYVPRSQAAGMEVGGRVTDVNLPKQVQQLGRDFEKAGLNQSIPVIERASQITPEQAAYITGPKSLLPDAALPQDVRAARQDLQKLFNITLKDRSGAAVTYQELERLKQEFGSGVFKTPQQLLTAVSRAREIIEAHYRGVASSYGPEVLQTYNDNLEAVGGRPFRPGTRGAPAAAPTAPAAAPAAGPYSDPDKERRYQEWKARQKP